MPTPAGYSGTPLPKKLGIKPGTTLATLNAPPDFAYSTPPTVAVPAPPASEALVTLEA